MGFRRIYCVYDDTVVGIIRAGRNVRRRASCATCLPYARDFHNDYGMILLEIPRDEKHAVPAVFPGNLRFYERAGVPTTKKPNIMRYRFDQYRF